MKFRTLEIAEDPYWAEGGSVQSRGYRYFQLGRDGVRTNYLFHHLVASAFLGERPPGLVVDHIDRDKLNNNVTTPHTKQGARVFLPRCLKHRPA